MQAMIERSTITQFSHFAMFVMTYTALSSCCSAAPRRRSPPSSHRTARTRRSPGRRRRCNCRRFRSGSCRNGLPRLARRAARSAGRAGQSRRPRAAAPTSRQGKYGLASLTAAMLEQGAGSRSSLEIADAIDFLGADLSAPAAASTAAAVRLHVPVAPRRRAADHGRRRAPAHVPERRARAAAPAAPDQPPAGARRPADDCAR